MKVIFTLFLTTIIISLFAQERYIDSDNKTQIWGNITIEDLESPPFSLWYKESIAGYTVTKDDQVGRAMFDTEVIVYLGTWCSDSQEWVPKFIQIWKTYGLDLENLQLIALHNADDKYKQSPEKTELHYNIESVPTFIFLRDGQEIGRIVEYPQTTLEEDLKSIVIGIK
jgi:hypothetical protein